jgi:hypothetical protein
MMANDADITLPTPDNRAGEALLAAISLSHILGDEPIRVTRRHIDLALGLPKTISRAIRAFLTGKAPEVDEEPQKLDPDAVFAALRQPVESLRLVDRVDFRVAPDLSGPFFQAFGVVHAYLAELAPPRTRETVLGPRDVRPNPLELARFRAVWRVVEDPKLVLAELARGVVPRRYVEALSGAYPDLYGYLRRAVLEAITELRGRQPSWEPTYKQDRALQALLQTSTLNARLIEEIQGLHGRVAQAEAARAPQRAPSSTALEANETRTQRLTRR